MSMLYLEDFTNARIKQVEPSIEPIEQALKTLSHIDFNETSVIM